MKDLQEMWTTAGFLLDKNNDGYAEEVNIQINGLSDTCLPIGLVDFCARLGLETAGLSFPLFDLNDENKINVSFAIDSRQEQAYCRIESANSVQITAPTNEALSQLLRWLASSWPYSLGESQIDSVTEISLKDDQVRIQGRNGEIVLGLSEEISSKQKSSSKLSGSDLPFKSLTDLWTTEGLYQGGRVDLNSEVNVEFAISGVITPNILKKMCQLSARIGLCATGVCFPLTSENEFPRVPELRFFIQSREGSDCQVNWRADSSVNTIEISFIGQEGAVTNALHYFSTAHPFAEGGHFGSWEVAQQREIDKSLLINKEWKDPGEKADFLQSVNDWAKDLKGDKPLFFTAYISEPFSIRQELAETAKEILGKGSNQCEIKIRSAFKPGFHWIEEEILSKLLGFKAQIKQIEILCRKDQAESGVELPNRWIQEMYPIDIILSERLSINPDDVIFTWEDNLPCTYIIKAISKNNELLFEECLEVPTTSLSWVDLVHSVNPTTGWLTLIEGKEIIRSTHNPTDRERFWEFFMNEVLEPLTKKLPIWDSKRGYQFPLFSEMNVSVEMSEEERKLGIEEERISPLEALHEDIYFNVLDYFYYYGERANGNPMTSPGGVHPFMHVTKGVPPKAAVEVYSWDPVTVTKRRTQALVFSHGSIEPQKAIIQVFDGSKWFEESSISSEWPEPKPIPSPLKNCEVERGVSLWRGATSYGGREIPVIEVSENIEAEFTSHHKLSLYKPTILIEAGHHPNEVSSMPAVINLIEELLSEEESIFKKVNLVVIPCANPDGRALHIKMAEDNPEWKHHAARYNAVGLEYSHFRFQDETIFGESEVVPKIVHRWLPDVIIDDHGIPSHEWIQPFAGYNSPPRFPESYWIPKAMIYGITRELDGDEFPEHKRLMDHVVRQVARKIGENKEIREKNIYWTERYKKYGADWVPEMFPIEKADDMIFYRWKTKIDRDSSVAISRYPEWCSLEFITEAADETVYGEVLELCMTAHQIFDREVIKMIGQCRVEHTIKYHDGLIQYKRKRPLTLK